MKGGKLLAQGGYGCVFLPGINCNGTSMTSKKYVSKIQKFDSTARNEIEIGKILQIINGYYNHFSPVCKFCNIDVATIKDDDKKKCTVFKKKGTKKFVVMKLLYIKGQDLIDYIIHHTNSIQIVSNLIHSYNHLLRTLTMLIGREIIHFDFKGTNILFNEIMQVPLLIDFGLSIQMKKINKNNLQNIFYTYAPEYYVWSLEIHYLCFLLHRNKNPTTSDLKHIAEVFTTNNKGLKNFSPNFLKKYEEKCYKQMKYYNSLEYNSRIEKILNYWKTFDNYSLSIMYLKFINDSNPTGFKKNNFIIFFSKLLLQNIDPNPQNRRSIIESIHIFNGFLYKKNINNISTFEEISKMFIENRKTIIDQSKKERTKQKSETKKMKNLFKKKNKKIKKIEK